MKNPKYHINTIATYAARFSLIFGFLQVLIFAIYPNNTSIEFGIAHLYPSSAIHLVLLVLVLIHSLKQGPGYRKHLKVVGWLLFNIPMAYLCFILVVLLH